MNMTLHIITACSRLSSLMRLADNVSWQASKAGDVLLRIRWHIAFQNFYQADPHGCVKFNEMLNLIPSDDWVWILDDDNEVHPDFFKVLTATLLGDELGTWAFVFDQNRKDQLGPVLRACPENMRVGGVDTAQVVFKKKLIGDKRFPEASPYADGEFYSELYRLHPAFFRFVNKPVVNFNGGVSHDDVSA